MQYGTEGVGFEGSTDSLYNVYQRKDSPGYFSNSDSFHVLKDVAL